MTFEAKSLESMSPTEPVLRPEDRDASVDFSARTPGQVLGHLQPYVLRPQPPPLPCRQ